MYKDKDKQREASKERMRRYRERKQGVTTEGVTSQGVTTASPPQTLTDVELLNSWARGEGTQYQQALVALGQLYK